MVRWFERIGRCSLEDIRYIEQTTDTYDDNPDLVYVQEELWLVDQYGNKQRFDQVREFDSDAAGTFFAYYICVGCEQPMRSWDDVTQHLDGPYGESAERTDVSAESYRKLYGF